MGIRISVFKNPLGDCTNGGVSSKVSSLTVVNCEGPFEPSDDAPAVMLDSHGEGIVRIVPAERTQGGGGWRVVLGKWFSMGGNYGATSDGRFSKKCEQLTGSWFYGAVAIHDRVE